MTDRVGPRHVELEDLAQLVEGTLERAPAAAARAHVAGCASCLAAYEEAVRDRATWLGAPDTFEAPATWEQASADVLERRHAGRMTIVRPGPTSRKRTSTRWAWAGAAAGLAAVIWFASAPLSPRGERLALPPAIRAAAEHASSRGLVLPGGEAGANASPIAFRTGAVPEVDPEIARALARYEQERDSAALHAACIGLVANGRLAIARDYIEEGLKHDAKDPVLQMLAADVAYRQSKLEDAATRLRDVLELRPRDAIALLDLGIVLSETGDTANAKRLFQSVAKDHRGTALGDRASREMATLPR